MLSHKQLVYRWCGPIRSAGSPGTRSPSDASGVHERRAKRPSEQEPNGRIIEVVRPSDQGAIRTHPSSLMTAPFK